METSSAGGAHTSTSEHAVLVASLIAALVVLLRQSFQLIDDSDSTSRRSSSITEPLMPPRLKSDAELYELLDRHKTSGKPERFQALDAFRGLTLCLMVFVNYGGGGFAAFTHSVWDGLTVADLVFPWFAWTLGFSVFLSSSAHQGASKPQELTRIATRSLKLFVLGLFINNGDNWSEWRIPGVLQSLSAAYLIVASADCCFSWHKHSRTRSSRVWTLAALDLVIGILPLVTANLLLTFMLRVPGCPTGYLGPGGLSDDGAHRNCTGGAHLYVDEQVFGIQHIFQTPTCQRHYQTGPYDPEGILNWLMVAATAYLGYLQAALFTATTQQHPLNEAEHRPLRQLFVCGSSLAVLGIVCGGLWVFPRGPWIPLNKNLWSLSYVLLTSGSASCVFALIVKLINSDSTVSLACAPCISVGKNSIAVYVMHEVFQHCAPFAAKPVNAGENVPHLELLLYNSVAVLVWVVVAQWMDKNKIFIKV